MLKSSLSLVEYFDARYFWDVKFQAWVRNLKLRRTPSSCILRVYLLGYCDNKNHISFCKEAQYVIYRQLFFFLRHSVGVRLQRQRYLRLNLQFFLNSSIFKALVDYSLKQILSN